MFLNEKYLNSTLSNQFAEPMLTQAQVEFVQHYLYDLNIYERVWYDLVSPNRIRILSKASDLILADITYDLLDDTFTLYFPVRDLTVTEENLPGGIGFSDETGTKLFILVAEGLISER